MSNVRHLGFGSTPTFANLYKEVARHTDNSGRLAYAKYDPSLGEPPTEAQKELLQNYKVEMPVLTFKGSEKLHGENMAVCYSNDELWIQGRNHVRTVSEDQNGMAAFVEQTRSTWMQMVNLLSSRDSVNTSTHTIVFDCEWAGGNIQKGNAACSGVDKGAYLFDYYRVVSNEDDADQVLHSTQGVGYRPHGIYNMAAFGALEVTLDFNKPEECEDTLKKIATVFEEHSPIAEHFEKPDNVGEGVYFYCMAAGTHPTYRLKTKGMKHGGKPKIPREPHRLPSDAEVIAIDVLANALTPEWRLSQAIDETKATEMKHIGEVIKWVMTDIHKEEQPAIEAASIPLKLAQGTIVQIIKDYYFESIKGF